MSKAAENDPRTPPEYDLSDLDELEEILNEPQDPKEVERRRKWKALREQKSFNHDEFGDALIEEYNIISVNGQIYVYDDGYYKQDQNIVLQKMIKEFQSIKNNQRAEVLSYIKIRTYIDRGSIVSDPYIVNLNNTRLDLRSGKLLDFTPEAIEFERIPVTYDQTAYNADLDKMLNRVFCGDQEIFRLFSEMLGYCLMKNCKYGKVFIFYGSGSNGKSTVLDLIKRFVGKRNFSSIELDKLTATFTTAELENKLVNIGDDINAGTLRETGTLKKIFTGNSLQVQRKGQDPFDLEPYATHIFSCNELPKFPDKSDGMYRRLSLIPFNAKFEKTDPGYDPLIEEKIFTDSALSYLLNLALEGALRLIQNGGFTEPGIVKEALEDYKIDNSTVLSWIYDKGYNEACLMDHSKETFYCDYQNWCKSVGIDHPTPFKWFNSEIASTFSFKSKQRRVKGDASRREQYFIKEDMSK